MEVMQRLRKLLTHRHRPSQAPPEQPERYVVTYRDMDTGKVVCKWVERPVAPRSVPPASGKRKAHCNGRCAEGRPCR